MVNEKLFWTKTLIKEIKLMSIIAIDGPVGSGKSTVARKLAKKAGFAYLDTGAMYRAIGWKAYITKINLTNEELDRLCAGTQLDMDLENEHLKVMIDGKDVSAEIRTPEMSRMASVVSAVASVRIHLVRMQREVGQSWAKRYGGVVIEGRDIGTVVFPDTPFKFYLDADIKERGKRRWQELQNKGINVSLDETISEVIKRDEKDQGREIDPLKKADDAMLVDTTGLSIEEVVDMILTKIRSTQ